MKFENMNPSNKDSYIAAWNDTCHALAEDGDKLTYISEMRSAIKSSPSRFTTRGLAYLQGATDALDTYQAGTMPQKMARLTLEELNS